jgi:hypothetical protein
MLPVDLDLSHPLATRFVPSHATKSRGTACPWRGILRLFSARDNSEIRSAIVEFVTVDMVAIEAISKDEAEDLAVEVDLDLPTASNSSSTDVARFLPVQTPTPLVRELGVGNVNEGVSNDGPIARSQRDLRRGPVLTDHDVADPDRALAHDRSLHGITMASILARCSAFMLYSAAVPSIDGRNSVYRHHAHRA